MGPHIIAFVIDGPIEWEATSIVVVGQSVWAHMICPSYAIPSFKDDLHSVGSSHEDAAKQPLHITFASIRPCCGLS